MHIRYTETRGGRTSAHRFDPIGEGGSGALTRETVINNRIGVAYCARLPIARPPLPLPYSRISRAIKHVRPFIGPCTFTNRAHVCAWACTSYPDVGVAPRRYVCSVARISILVPVAIGRLTTLTGLRQGDKVGRWTWFIPPIQEDGTVIIERAIELLSIIYIYMMLLFTRQRKVCMRMMQMKSRNRRNSMFLWCFRWIRKYRFNSVIIIVVVVVENLSIVIIRNLVAKLCSARVSRSCFI